MDQSHHSDELEERKIQEDQSPTYRASGAIRDYNPSFWADPSEFN